MTNKATQHVSCSLPFVKLADKATWTCIQQVSCSLCFKNWMTHALFFSLSASLFFISQYAPNFIFPFLSPEIAWKLPHSWWQCFKLMSVSLSSLQLHRLIENRNPLWPSLLVCLVSSLFYYSSLIFLHYVAILVCLENSFWHQSPSVSFIDAFHKAFAMYKETDTQDKVEIALKVMNDSSDGKTAFQSALLQTLLEHRLCMLDYIFSSQLLLIIFVPSAHSDSLKTPNWTLIPFWMSFSLLWLWICIMRNLSTGWWIVSWALALGVLEKLPASDMGKYQPLQCWSGTSSPGLTSTICILPCINNSQLELWVNTIRVYQWFRRVGEKDWPVRVPESMNTPDFRAVVRLRSSFSQVLLCWS